MRSLIRREIVTRTYRILDLFDLLASTSSKPRLCLYEMVDKDMELRSKSVPMESLKVVINEAKDDDPSERLEDDDPTERLKDDTADNAAGRNLRELAKGAGLEEVTASMPRGGSRRLGKLNRRVESS